MREAFIERLTEIAERDTRVMLITGDLGFGVLTDFARRFPRQFLNAGVAEQNMTSLAAGMALEGHVVFTYSIANFVFMRCLEQIRNDAAYHRANVNVVCVGSGFSYGQLGMSHHATEDLSIMRAIPEVTVISPGDDWEAAEATEAVVDQPGTCYIRLDRSSAGRTQRPGERFSLGKMRRLRDGRDVTLIATGGMLAVAMGAAVRLAATQIQCRVMSCHTIVPMDEEALLSAAQETGGIVTLEEHTIHGGLGGAVAERLLESSNRPRLFHRLGVRGEFVSTVGSQAYLRRQQGLNVESVVDTVAHLVHSRDGASIKRAA